MTLWGKYRARRHLLLFGLLLWLGSSVPAYAVPMTNDPNGFQDLTWGANLSDRQELEVARAGQHINEFQLRSGTPSYAGTPVERIRFLAIDGQFARVTIRYHGNNEHKHILSYLEQQFGSLERIPGQMVRGLNQQYTWRGNDTEINLTYHANTERGYLFIDSRTLAPRFNDRITDSAE
ncbi:MAG: hypothetical protein OEV08_04080 [Nitrospira sp.]|nr:hypothetical protein [Nitrospira sp.]